VYEHARAAWTLSPCQTRDVDFVVSRLSPLTTSAALACALRRVHKRILTSPLTPPQLPRGAATADPDSAASSTSAAASPPLVCSRTWCETTPRSFAAPAIRMATRPSKSSKSGDRRLSRSHPQEPRAARRSAASWYYSI
jgi:hypothetical protein